MIVMHTQYNNYYKGLGLQNNAYSNNSTFNNQDHHLRNLKFCRNKFAFKPLIISIHVLSDKISDRDFSYLSNQLCISKVGEKPSLGDIITYAHSQIIESKYIAIVNTNIYLKTSTDLFEQLDSIASRFTNLGLTLTRRLDIITTQLSTVVSVIPDLSSSDGWIFKTKNFQETKINTSSFEDIAFGAKNSQNIIRIAFERNGYIFANSCNYISAIT